MQDFFRNASAPEHEFFDEGPVIHNVRSLTTSSLSGSIDTTSIDAFRQGVEITHIKHFDAGVVKISAGEPGHVLKKNRFGMDFQLRTEPAFVEFASFTPAEMVATNGETNSSFYARDSGELENVAMNGTIEPLTIRAVASFFSIETPVESHSIKGAVMSGNETVFGTTDRVLTVDERAPSHSVIPYLDEMFIVENSTLAPFADRRLARNVVTSSNYPIDLADVVGQLTGSTDGYISDDQRSATCGWTFSDVQLKGTDSIAFGELSY